VYRFKGDLKKLVAVHSTIQCHGNNGRITLDDCCPQAESFLFMMSLFYNTHSNKHSNEELMERILIIIVLLLSSSVHASDLGSLGIMKADDVTKLLPEIKGLDFPQGFFGLSVAIEQDYMVISAPYASYTGALAVYQKVNNDWQLMQMLDASSLDGIDHLGSAVDIHGGTIFVGAKDSNLAAQEAGAILMFQLVGDRWQNTGHVLSPNPKAYGYFGAYLKMVGDLAVVAEDTGVNQSGHFYVYDISGENWQLLKVIDDMDLEGQPGTSDLIVALDQTHLVLSRSGSGSSGSLVRVYDLADPSWQTYQTIHSPVPSHTFGNALSIDTQQLVIADSSLNSDNGIVYFYEKVNDVWQLEQSVFGPEHEPDKEFGSTVHISNDQLLVGSYGDNELAGTAGAVFYFARIGGEWQQQQKLLASDGVVFDRFGIESELGESEIIISSIYADSPSNNSGKVYSFTFDGSVWSERQILEPLPQHDSLLFSNGLAMNEDWLVVGADGDSDQGNKAGAVYVYRKQNGSLVFEEKLYAQQAAADQQFGKKIVIQNDKMLIAATGNRVSHGYVHYYRLIEGQWVFQTTGYFS
jgi:hypothetical protein